MYNAKAGMGAIVKGASGTLKNQAMSRDIAESGEVKYTGEFMWHALNWVTASAIV